MKTLDEINGKNPFKVPENYFEEVNQRIIASTSGEGNKQEEKPLKRSLYVRFRPYILAAASVAAFAVLSYTAARIFFPSSKENGIAEMSFEELSATAINDIDVTSLEQSTEMTSFSDEMPGLSRPELIDCLISENINVNEIYELF
jgi:hypothetical protein